MAKVKLFTAHRNLGCLGIQIGPWYMDFFKTPYWGWYSNTPLGKAWVELWPKPKLLRREWVSGGSYHSYHYCHGKRLTRSYKLEDC